MACFRYMPAAKRSDIRPVNVDSGSFEYDRENQRQWCAARRGAPPSSGHRSGPQMRKAKLIGPRREAVTGSVVAAARRESCVTHGAPDQLPGGRYSRCLILAPDRCGRRDPWAADTRLAQFRSRTMMSCSPSAVWPPETSPRSRASSAACRTASPAMSPARLSGISRTMTAGY